MVIISMEDMICYDLLNERVAEGDAFDPHDFKFSTGKQGYLASRRAPLILLMISILNSVGKHGENFCVKRLSLSPIIIIECKCLGQGAK